MHAIRGAFQPAGGTIAELSRRMFKKLDSDRSGMLSRDEVTRTGVLQKLGVAKTLDEAKAMFDGADVNKDGKLSPIESQVMFSSMMVQNPDIIALIAMMTAEEAAEEGEPSMVERAAEKPAPDKAPEEPKAEDLAPPAAVLIWRQAAQPQPVQGELDLTA